jgi:hypothetical protein
VREATIVKAVAVIRRRHFGSCRKLPSGRCQASYWYQGRRQTAPRTFAAKADAVAFLSTRETGILRGEWAAPSAGKVTFGEFAGKWLEGQVHLRPRTAELYRYLLRSHLGPAFGAQQISAITNSEVAAWYRSLPRGCLGQPLRPTGSWRR